MAVVPLGLGRSRSIHLVRQSSPERTSRYAPARLIARRRDTSGRRLDGRARLSRGRESFAVLGTIASLGHKEVATTLDRYSLALPALGAEAMGRLDAVLGRWPLDAPDEGPTAAPSAELWVNEEPAAWSLAGSGNDKGPR